MTIVTRNTVRNLTGRILQLQMDINVKHLLNYLLLHHLTVIKILHAHLHMIPNLPIKFHQNPLSSLGLQGFNM